MYEWWRFQRYRICLKKLEIRISIEKLNFFLLHLERSIQTKLELEKEPKTPIQKIAGWALSIVVCAWNVRNKPKTLEQTQNSKTKNHGAGVEHRGVCVECSKQTQNREQTGPPRHPSPVLPPPSRLLPHPSNN